MKTKTLPLILLALLLTACGVDVSLSTDPANVTNAAAEIADFDLPAGYYADFSSDVMGYSVAAYTRGDGPSHLYLIQSDNESDGEKLAQVLDELVIGSGDPQTRMTVSRKSFRHRAWARKHPGDQRCCQFRGSFLPSSRSWFPGQRRTSPSGFI